MANAPARSTGERHPLVRTACVVYCLLSPFVLAQQVDDRHAARMEEGLELFKAEVRPLLLEKCYACHGEGQTMGGLDLSSHGSLTSSGKVGESAAESTLVAVLRHEREPFMPFGQDKLPESSIEAVARWIDLGAPYDKALFGDTALDRLADANPSEGFWAFQPLANEAQPELSDESAVANPIDKFVLAKLEAAGIRQNPSADRRTLIRRASLDLLGLPPSPEQVEAFVKDPAPDAYERLIGDMLESPHYGERWARHWMDIARFAESYGFEEDYDRPYAYHYRDFLIKALNRDMPYDRFVRLQIAGDELEPENPLALMATGFLGAGAFSTQLTEAEFETARYDELDDMIGTIGTAMLGLTVGCARCHDHKHDPISARDYYNMAAVFGRTTRTLIEYDPSPGQFREEKANWKAERDKLCEKRRKIEQAALGKAFQEWLSDRAPGVETDSWQVLKIKNLTTGSNARTDVLDDGSVLFSGDNADFEAYHFSFEFASTGVRALRIEALTHPSLPASGPGRARDGQFLMGVVSAKASPAGNSKAEPVEIKFSRARATDQLDEGTSSITAAITDPGQKSGWAIRPESTGADHAAILDFKEPLGFDGGTRLAVTMRFGFNPHFSLGRVRLSVSAEDEPAFQIGRGISQAVAEGLSALRTIGPEALSEEHEAALLSRFAQADEKWQIATAAIRDHESRVPITAVTKIQASAEGFKPARHNSDGKGYPHFFEQTHVLRRGDPSQKAARAQPAFLPVLVRGDTQREQWPAKPPLGWKRSGFHRASLARWITDPDGGAGALLARVIVNRLWHHHFGTGIVATPSNFGMMGARPTHPALLDWLSRDLIANGWRLKRLHRMIMSSSTYKTSSASDEPRNAKDSANRLRWRWTPRRLEAEAIRDSLLSVSRMLDSRMHGLGTLSEASLRRSVYFFVKRSELIPSMMLFDWPEHLVGIGNRPSTTVAPQALVFLNSPQTRQYAEGLARRVKGPDPATTVDAAYQVAFARPAKAAELSAGSAFLASQRARYEADGRGDPSHLALIDYCQSLLSLNEFLYIR